MTLKKKAFENIVGKEKILVTIVFNPSQKENLVFKFIFNLLSANAFSLDQPRNLLFGKELRGGLMFPCMLTSLTLDLIILTFNEP